MPILQPAAFIDKDGTLIEDVPYNVDPALLRFAPGAVDALRLLSAHGHAIVVITNQPGIAMRLFDHTALDRLRDALIQRLADEGVRLAGFHACPHGGEARGFAACRCRKPAPGLIFNAAARHGLALAQSWMVGDILDDVEAGSRAGCRTVLLDVGHETEWRQGPGRTPTHVAPDLLAAAKLIVRAAQGRVDGAADALGEGLADGLVDHEGRLSPSPANTSGNGRISGKT